MTRTHDYRGWFYRAIALDPDAPVFAASAPFAETCSSVVSANACSLREQHGEAWTRYVDAVAEEVDLVAAVRQHSDFYVNNVGMRDETLVILDWEDFSRKYLPGFDLALPLLSLNEFSPSRIRANTSRCGPYSWILSAGLARMEFSHSLLFRLLPTYLTLVASMKVELGYSQALPARAAAAVPQAIEEVNLAQRTAATTFSGNLA